MSDELCGAQHHSIQGPLGRCIEPAGHTANHATVPIAKTGWYPKARQVWSEPPLSTDLVGVQGEKEQPR